MRSGRSGSRSIHRRASASSPATGSRSSSAGRSRRRSPSWRWPGDRGWPHEGPARAADARPPEGGAPGVHRQHRRAHRRDHRCARLPRRPPPAAVGWDWRRAHRRREEGDARDAAAGGPGGHRAPATPLPARRRDEGGVRRQRLRDCHGGRRDEGVRHQGSGGPRGLRTVAPDRRRGEHHCVRENNMGTTKARKQRKRLFRAPGHKRTPFLSAHVDKALRDKNAWLPRAVPVRKGDQVKVFRGDFYGLSGKGGAVDDRSRMVTVEEIVLEKMDKKKVAPPLPPPYLVITAFDESAPRRRERLAKPKEEKG